MNKAFFYLKAKGAAEAAPFFAQYRILLIAVLFIKPVQNP